MGIAALEDKIVQHAVGKVINQIWEEDFMGFSYGFRPGRSQQDALDALSVGIMRKKVTGCSIWTSGHFSTKSNIRGWLNSLSIG